MSVLDIYKNKFKKYFLSKYKALNIDIITTNTIKKKISLILGYKVFSFYNDMVRCDKI